MKILFISLGCDKNLVDIRHYLPEIEDPKSIGVTESVYYPVLENILEENDTLEDRIAAIHRDIHDLIPKHITKEDIFASINYNMHLEYGLGNADDIDHLGKPYHRAHSIRHHRQAHVL